MLSILRNKTYRTLFLAQVIALLGTGIATVALALLAFDLSGPNAGQVLGTALAIKMVAYVGVAPFAAALSEKLPRRGLLVCLDIVRALIVLCLPFVTAVWQVYALIFILQSASAAFTPTFQATIPDVLPDESEYTRALSLSRLAYDLENLVSPMLAAALLTVMAFSDLFVGTAIGFAVSALLVLSVRLPKQTQARRDFRQSFMQRVTNGLRVYLATPRLRGLLAVNLVVAAAGSMVIVNTVVIVQSSFGLSEQETAFAFAAFGGGSMMAALGLPLLLDRFSDRPIMLLAATLLLVALVVGSTLTSFVSLISVWFVLGAGYAAAQTPSGRLLRRSSHPEDRPALFAAQFTLSHAMWLIAYPLAGFVGGVAGIPIAFLVLSGLAAVGLAAALIVWPKADPADVEHRPTDLAQDDPHWSDGVRTGKFQHTHDYIIDNHHAHWPKDG
ncbi:MAG: MFS transporter [Hyphomicrobiales bacterium]